MKNLKHRSSVVLCLNYIFSCTYCDVFSAISDVEKLVTTEYHLITTLENYVSAEQQRLDRLKRHVESYKQHHQRAIQDVEYVFNPINAFTLVKKLTADFQSVEYLITTNYSQAYLSNISIIKENFKFPTEEDLNGAALALIRLQDTYKLRTSSLARGELKSVTYGVEMTSSDCFELGKLCYGNGDYHHAYFWFKEANIRALSESNIADDRTDILEYLAYSAYKQGFIPLALKITNELLAILPSHPRARENKEYFEYVLESDEYTIEQDQLEFEPAPYNRDDMRRTYKALCRGDLHPPIELTSKLRCRYVNHGNPFLFLAPFKLEEAYLNPNIYVFHDVISDAEIETVKQLATLKFQRAKVHYGGGTKISPVRVAKIAWLSDEQHKHISDISRRVGDMTTLSMKTAELLQVVNYGIGGHYEPHFDFAENEEEFPFAELGTGNRIATFIYYMSDVAEGGATVFPEVLASVKPKKRSALFWYNLHENGIVDKNTLHAACPVLVGSKWMCNKWLHERDQEFIRPCSLKNSPEG